MSADSTGGQRPVVLWAVPRSRSTAFERTFVEREDFEVLHEPFSATYYHSPERRNDRYLDGDPDPYACAENVLAEILRPRDRRLFVKDMAYYTTAFMSREFVSHFTNTFLIRDPRKTLASFHAKERTFTFEEAGFEQLARLYDHVVQQDGVHPLVVDAADLVRDPEATLRAYCAALDIPFVANALSWEPQKVPEFSTWDSWHDQAQHSTGIGEVDDPGRELPAHLDEMYHRCLPHYERLRAAKLTPAGATPD